ncbi:MAG: lipopolysaccharide heptosyltransferase II [Gammaproteobacteria bacterium]
MSKPRVLIVGPAWVGDMVMAQALVQTVAANQPGVAIDVLAPAWSEPLIERMPKVRRAIPLPLGHGELGWSVRRQLGLTLRARNYIQAIVIPRSFKAALVPFHAKIPLRTGFLGESRYGLLNDIRKLDKGILDGTAKRYVALGHERGAPQPPAVPSPQLTAIEDDELLARLGLNKGALVALMPGAEYGPAKQWPAEHFGRLAGALIAHGVQVVVVGSAKEQSLGEQIATAAPGTRNVCGETTMVEAIDLLSSADVAVSNDSGLMHVAAAVGCSVVGIYGSSSPIFTPPLTRKSNVLWKQLDCSPCFKRTCPLGHTRCLTELAPDQVSDVVINLLNT